MKAFCTQLPEDRLLDRRVVMDYSQILDDDAKNPTIIIPETGAKLTLASSLQTVNYFVSRLVRIQLPEVALGLLRPLVFVSWLSTKRYILFYSNVW